MFENNGKIKFIIKNCNIKKVVRNYENNWLSASMLGRHLFGHNQISVLEGRHIFGNDRISAALTLRH